MHDVNCVKTYKKNCAPLIWQLKVIDNRHSVQKIQKSLMQQIGANQAFFAATTNMLTNWIEIKETWIFWEVYVKVRHIWLFANTVCI